MNCDDVQQQLGMHREGQLNDETSRSVDTHLTSCPRCRTKAAELAGVIRAVADLPVEQPPPGFADAVMAKVRLQARQPTRWQRLFVPLWMKPPVYAAALGLVIAGGWLLIRSTTPPMQVAQQLEAQESRDRTTVIPELAPPPPEKRFAAPESAPPSTALDRAAEHPASELRKPLETDTPSPQTTAPAHRLAREQTAMTGAASAPPPTSIAPPFAPTPQAEEELSVVLAGSPGDPKALARLRAAVARAGGTPLSTEAETADSFRLTIDAARLEALRAELALLASIPPQGSSADAVPPAEAVAPSARFQISSASKPSPLRVRPHLQWTGSAASSAP